MPEISAIHTNVPLTNLAIGYPTTGLISQRLLLDLPVQKKSDLFYIFDAARSKEIQTDDKRSPGSNAVEVDFDLTTDNYNCGGHALQAIVPDEEAENADSPLQPQADKTDFLVDKLLLNQEIALAAALAAGLSGSDPANEWNDYTNGDPFADVTLAQNTIEDATGFKPNVIAMDSKVWRALKDHPDMIDRVKYTGTGDRPGEVSLRGAAEVFEVDEIIVSTAMKNTAVEGQTASLSRVWGDEVIVAYRPARAGLKIPALGYRMVWSPFMGSRMGWQVKTWRNEERGGTMIRAQKYYDQKITLAGAGYILQNRLT